MTRPKKIAATAAARFDMASDIVRRIESIEAERDKLAEDVRRLYQEARFADVKVLRRVIKTLRQNRAERDARQAIIDEAALERMTGLMAP
jgi:uncharacterized protein (UPF0335 family)